MEMMTTNLGVAVRYSAFDPESGNVLVKKLRAQGREHFKVRIFLEGPDCGSVERVVYTLHPTFPRPRREVTRGPDFELEIWTWGIFTLHVEIYDREGRVDKRVVDLDYAPQIMQAQTDDLLRRVD